MKNFLNKFPNLLLSLIICFVLTGCSSTGVRMSDSSPWETIQFEDQANALDVDFIDNVPPLNVAKLKKNPTLSINSGASNRVIYLHMDQFRENSPHIKAIGGGKIKNPLMELKAK